MTSRRLRRLRRTRAVMVVSSIVLLVASASLVMQNLPAAATTALFAVPLALLTFLLLLFVEWVEDEERGR